MNRMHKRTFKHKLQFVSLVKLVDREIDDSTHFQTNVCKPDCDEHEFLESLNLKPWEYRVEYAKGDMLQVRLDMDDRCLITVELDDQIIAMHLSLMVSERRWSREHPEAWDEI